MIFIYKHVWNKYSNRSNLSSFALKKSLRIVKLTFCTLKIGKIRFNLAFFNGLINLMLIFALILLIYYTENTKAGVAQLVRASES